MDDSISRQAERLKGLPSARPEPLSDLCDGCDYLGKSCVGEGCSKLQELEQPEPQWIPCSERLPEEYGEYICTMENGQVQECGFVPENQRGLVDGWSTCEADGHKFLGYVDVLAWMPLPEPYTERRE